MSATMPTESELSKNKPDEVAASALALAAEELRKSLERLRQEGAAAFNRGDFARAKACAEVAEKRQSLCSRTEGLLDEVSELVPGGEVVPEAGCEDDGGGHVFAPPPPGLPRLGRGERTPEEAYYGPILTALVELDGRARMRDVIDVVGRQMAGRLREVDHDTLESNPTTPRWCNTAQWARNTLKERGFLKPDSGYGWWEISDAGRDALSRGEFH